jgi:hypothetical protein
MFKLLKSIFIFNIIKKAKKYILFILSCLLIMIVFNFILDDIINIVDNQLYILIFKWIINIFLITIVILNIKKILSLNYIELQNDTFNYNDDFELKKDNIMNKTKLTSKSDLIINKYKKTRA